MKHIHSATSARARWSWVAREHGLPLVVYTFVALTLTWPLVLHLTTAFPSEPGEGAQDVWEKMWNLWWFSRALREGVNLFQTDMLFYPKGASLLFHPLNPVSAIMALPFRALFGPIASYNIVVLLSFVLAGYATFLVLRQMECGRLAALVGGLAFTACAFHTIHMRLSHLELMPIQWLPFYVLALQALLRRPSVAAVATTTLVLLLLIFTSLYLTLYAALLTVVWLLWAAWRSRRDWPALLRGVGGLAIAGALVLIVAGPTMLLPMAAETRRTSYMVQSVDTSAQRAAGVFDLVLPPPTHLIRNVVAVPMPRSSSVFAGYVPLALAILGATTRLRHAARWLALALVAWLFALGPTLPLYHWLYALPLFQVSRYPDRFAILTVLSVAIMAGLGVDWIVKRWGSRGTLAGGVLFAAILVGSFGGPYTLARPFDNPIYHQIAQEAEPFTVAELPITRVNSAWLAMYAQTLHRHAILNGALARRVPSIPYEWMPMVRQWRDPIIPDDIDTQRPESRATALRYFGLRYLIFHRDDGGKPVVPPSAEDIARASGVPVEIIYEDAVLVAYRFTVPPGSAVLPAIAKLGTGWYDLESPGTDAHRWARDGRGTFDLYAPDSRSVAIRIKLASYHTPRTVRLVLDGQQVGQIDAQPWTNEIVTPPLLIAEGAHQLEVVAVEPPTTPREAEGADDDRPLSVGVWSMELEAR